MASISVYIVVAIVCRIVVKIVIPMVVCNSLLALEVIVAIVIHHVSSICDCVRILVIFVTILSEVPLTSIVVGMVVLVWVGGVAILTTAREKAHDSGLAHVRICRCSGGRENRPRGH